MERAANLCFDWIYQRAPVLFPSSISEEKDWLFNVVCGVGNNGGDGLVIARQLLRNGYNVGITIIHISDKPSRDFKTNLDKLGAAAKKGIVHVKKSSDVPDFHPESVIIDAVFGSGINRPAEGIAGDIIKSINASRAAVVSIDLPSGLFAEDNADNNFDLVVRSHYVLTFQTPKLAFFLAECAEFVGQVHVLDIGLHQEYMNKVEADYYLITQPLAASLRIPRQRFSHKGTFGHALVVGGSAGQWGSISLTTRACLKSGAGLVTAHTGSGGVGLILSQSPEAMVLSDSDPEKVTEIPSELSTYGAIAVGPGLGTGKEASLVLKQLIQNSTTPMVLDADALNILSENKTWWSFLPKGSILTPHPGEFARLIGDKLSHFEGLQKQIELSKKHGVYILLKGAHSSLSTPEGKIWINSSGNPGMASGGMGDTLTGIIAGLLAGGYSSQNAALLGMFLHGKAGDLALDRESMESLLATDLIDFLGAAFKSLSDVESI